ncbi:MAG: hypothetical protein ACFE0Q_11255 [Anaerolineae bacterium]
MITRDMREVKSQQVKHWWSRVRQYTQLSERLSQATVNDLDRVQDIEQCIHTLNAQFRAVEQIPYPKSATHIRRALLAFLMNMITVMQHARLENVDDRNVIFDIAKVDKNMVEIYLEEYGLSL